jgi:hypothetical protein
MFLICFLSHYSLHSIIMVSLCIHLYLILSILLAFSKILNGVSCYQDQELKSVFYCKLIFIYIIIPHLITSSLINRYDLMDYSHRIGKKMILILNLILYGHLLNNIHINYLEY